MSKRAEQRGLEAHPDKVFRYKKIGDADGVMTGESVKSQQYIRDYFIEGYEQAEKDTTDRAAKWIREHWREYIWGPDADGCIGFGLWENDFRKAMEEE